MQRNALPKFVDLFYPTLCALKSRRGRATIAEIDADVASALNFPAAVRNIPHKHLNQTELQYRLAWVRTALRKYGAVQNRDRGVWEITEQGRAISELHAREIYSILYYVEA